MRKIILSLCLSVAFLGFSACTDEDDVLNPTQEYENVHRKFSYPYTGHLNWRPYADYEKVVFKPEELNSKISTFDKAVNGEITMPDMDIPTAVISMETHFNYGWLAKRNNVDYSTPYEEQTFSFTVPLRNSKVNGVAMKNGYLNMVRNISNVMGNKFMQACDLYVSNQTKNAITFSLDIRRRIHLTEDSVFRVIAQIHYPPIVPDSVISVWTETEPEYEENGRYYSFVNMSSSAPNLRLGLITVIDTTVGKQKVLIVPMPGGVWETVEFDAFSIRWQMVPNIISTLYRWKREAGIIDLIDFADVKLPVARNTLQNEKYYQLSVSRVVYYSQMMQVAHHLNSIMECHFPEDLGGM